MYFLKNQVHTLKTAHTNLILQVRRVIRCPLRGQLHVICERSLVDAPRQLRVFAPQMPAVSVSVPGMPACPSRSAYVARSLRLWSSLRPISSSQLHTLLHFHPCPINLVVFKGTYLSRRGGLILEGASRLDAFSVYPFPAWLPSYGPGGPAGAPEAGPPRSSRTKGSSPQTSCAHAG